MIQKLTYNTLEVLYKSQTGKHITNSLKIYYNCTIDFQGNFLIIETTETINEKIKIKRTILSLNEIVSYSFISENT